MDNTWASCPMKTLKLQCSYHVCGITRVGTGAFGTMALNAERTWHSDSKCNKDLKTHVPYLKHTQTHV
jgi:hypothetical protein